MPVTLLSFDRRANIVEILTGMADHPSSAKGVYGLGRRRARRLGPSIGCCLLTPNGTIAMVLDLGGPRPTIPPTGYFHELGWEGRSVSLGL